MLLAAGDREAKDLSVVLRSLPAAKPRLYEVRASGADGRLLTRRDATLEAGAKSVKVELAMPSELGNQTTRDRGRGRPIGRYRAFARRTLAPPSGRDRRAAERQRTAAAQREFLSGAGAGTVRRNPPRAGYRFAEAPARGADLLRIRDRILRRRRRRSTNGSRPAACCCALPGRTSPSRTTRCCRCDCAVAVARSAARCRGSSRQSSPPLPPTAHLPDWRSRPM